MRAIRDIRGIREIRKHFAGGGETPFDFGNGLGLNGSNQYGTLATLINTNSTTTISWWGKVTAFDSGNLFGNGAENNTTVRFINDTTLRWFIGGINKEFTVPTMSTGTKYHNMITVDATNIRFYQNGVESSTMALTKPPDLNLNQIGRFFNGGSGFWYNGAPDEIAITTSAGGSLANAVSLYNGGSGAEASAILGPLDAYYRFNSSDGTDSSGNSNTLTLFNSPTFPPF